MEKAQMAQMVQIPVALAKRILNNTKDIGIVREIASALAGGDEAEATPRKRAATAAEKSGKAAKKGKAKRESGPRVPVTESAAAVLEKMPPVDAIASEELRPMSGLSKPVYQRAMKYLLEQKKVTSEGQRRAMKYARVAA